MWGCGGPGGRTRVAVSSALAVPSDRAATGPPVPARVEAIWLSRAATPRANWTASSAGSDPASTAMAAPVRASSAIDRAMASARRGPRTGTSRPAGPESANAPAACGTKHRPVSTGLSPRPCCRYSVTSRTWAALKAPTAIKVRLAPAMPRSLSWARSSSGAGALLSRTTNARARGSRTAGSSSFCRFRQAGGPVRVARVSGGGRGSGLVRRPRRRGLARAGDG